MVGLILHPIFETDERSIFFLFHFSEHAVGLVSLQVTSGGSIISNAVVFEYKKRSNIDESQFHNFCNIKEEQYNQYMYENDTLLKFILIHRIESIQDDAYTHGSSLVNKYEVS